jgi:hypothetical protein
MGIGRLVLVLLPMASAACILPKGTAGDGGAPGQDGGRGAEAAGGATGAGCAQDRETGITLCAALSLCPTIVVDPDLYPNCGFRVRGEVIDLECVCSGSLCPIGVAATCAEAKQLLAGQNATMVCSQINEGRCTSAAHPAPSGSSSPCDHTCSSQCGGDPGCIKSCGC